MPSVCRPVCRAIGCTTPSVASSGPIIGQVPGGNGVGGGEGPIGSTGPGPGGGEGPIGSTGPGPGTMKDDRKNQSLGRLPLMPPMMGASDVFTDGGFLMSYGADWPPLYKAVPNFVDRLLKGAKPADLPVQQPTSFEFVINMTTAQASGLSIPASVQLLANRIIE